MFGFFKKDKKPQEKPKGPPQVGKTDLCLDDTRSLAMRVCSRFLARRAWVLPSGPPRHLLGS